MKKLSNAYVVMIGLCILAVVNTPLRSQMLYWPAEHTVGYNLQPAHASMLTYTNQAEARTGSVENSSTQSLDGVWNFVMLNMTDDVNRYISNPLSQQWSTISVPSNWSTQDLTSDIIMDKATQGASSNRILGVYHRSLSINTIDTDRELFLHFASVSNRYQLYINGRFVGSSNVDMRLPSEYQISDFVLEGENQIVVVALQRDQLHSRSQLGLQWNGIDGNVMLIDRPSVRVQDIFINSVVNDDNTSALLTLDIAIAQLSNQTIEDYTITVELYDGSRKVDLDPSQTVMTLTDVAQKNGRLSIDIANPKTWSEASPHLYTLLATLTNSAGKITEVIPQQVGFRRINWAGRHLTVNEKKTTLLGINYHEYDPATGSTLSKSRLEEDVLLMKRHNINAIRTLSPPSPYLYELTDKYGLFVLAQAQDNRGIKDDVMTSRKTPSATVESITRMIDRDKNHPSIISWATGTSQNQGYKEKAIISWLQSYDPHRLTYRAETKGAAAHSLVETSAQSYQKSYNNSQSSPFGPSVTKPIIYLNDDGSTPDIALVDSVILALDDHYGFAGGFFYDWVDINLATQFLESSADASPEDDLDYDAPFLPQNNLITSDRQVKSQLLDVKKLFQPFEINLIGSELSIHATRQLPSTSAYHIKVSLLEGGVSVRDTMLVLDFTKDQEKTINLKMEVQNLEIENIIEVSIKTSADLPWAEMGHEVAWEQIIVHSPEWEPEPVKATTVDTIDGRYHVHTDDFTAIIDNTTGYVSIIDKDGNPVTDGKIRPTFWDHTQATDRIDQKSTLWQNPEMRLDTIRINKGKQIFSMYTLHTIGDSLATQKTLYQIYGINHLYIKVDIDLNPNIAAPPRTGMQINLPSSYDTIMYYGRGPLTTDESRHIGSRFGKYTLSANDIANNIHRGVDSGTRYDIRSIDIISPTEVLTIERYLPISASYLPAALTPTPRNASTNQGQNVLIVEHCANTAKKKNSLTPNIGVTFAREDKHKLRYDFNLTYKRKDRTQ